MHLAGYPSGLVSSNWWHPDRFARTLGLEGKEALIRGYGVRELASAVPTLSISKSAGLAARIAGDALDLATLSSALRPDNPKRGNAAMAHSARCRHHVLDLAAYAGTKVVHRRGRAGNGIIRVEAVCRADHGRLAAWPVKTSRCRRIIAPRALWRPRSRSRSGKFTKPPLIRFGQIVGVGIVPVDIRKGATHGKRHEACSTERPIPSRQPFLGHSGRCDDARPRLGSRRARAHRSRRRDRDRSDARRAGRPPENRQQAAGRRLCGEPEVERSITIGKACGRALPALARPEDAAADHGRLRDRACDRRRPHALEGRGAARPRLRMGL